MALLVVSRRGTYVSADSLAYVGTARNLLEGRGYTASPGSPPISNFPPLYPLVLAAVGWFGPDPLTVARFLSPVLFGVTVLVVGLLVRRVTGSLGLAVAGQLLALSAVDLLAYHSAALSEPLFLLFALLALLAVAVSLRSDRAWPVCVAGLLAGLATLTRYVGLAVAVAGVGALFWGGVHRRWTRLAAFATLALAPLGIWMAWVSGTEGRASNRSAVLHAPGLDYFVGGVRTATRWVLPGGGPLPLRATVALGVVLLLAVAARRERPAATSLSARALDIPQLLALFAVAYLLALLVDRWLFDVTGRLDARFLIPIHIVAIVLALRAVAGRDGKRSKLGILVLSIVVGLQLAAGAFWLFDASTDPSVRPGGFTAPGWRDSTLMAEVRSLPTTAPVFTNQADVVYFHTGHTAHPLPEKAEFLTGRPNRAYEAELDGMLQRLGSDGIVVYFTAPPARRVFLPTADELAARLHLTTVVRDTVGVVFRATPS